MEIERPHAELLESFSARRVQYPSTGLHIDHQWRTACIWMACFAEPLTSDPSACVTFVFISPCSNGSTDPGDKNACGVMKEKGKGTSWMLEWALNVFQQPLIDIRDARWVDGRAPPVSGGLLLLNAGRCRREACLITGWLQTPRLLLCQDGGHLGVRSDILSNCIILLSMLTGYVIFHRSVPIIRARLSRKDPPDVCDPFAIGLGPPTHPPRNRTPTRSRRKVPRALQRKCLAGGWG